MSENGAGESSNRRDREGREGQERETDGEYYGETWVYESIVGAFPLVSVTDAQAILIQFVVFEGALLLLALVYGLWSAVPAGTAAILVAVVGSAAMLDFGDSIRSLPPLEAYRRFLFGSSIEIVLSHLAYIALITYLFVVDPRMGHSVLITEILGNEPPALAVYFMLLVLWDVCYRIGTNWWASLLGLWRTYKYRNELDDEVAQGFRRIDLDNILFGGFQVVLVPFVVNHPLLIFAVGGHVLAVTLVSGASFVFLTR